MNFLSSSATQLTTMSSFSAMQGRLLSKEQPSTMSLAACSRWAVSSTTTGGLPGPAPMAGLPEVRAAWTTPGPPVAATRRTARCFISRSRASMLGTVRVETSPSGAPPAAREWRTRSTAARVLRTAPGWGAKTTELPPASMQIVLLITEAIGFVEGVMEAMTPKGPSSSSISPLSPETALVVKYSGPGVFRMASCFLTILSSRRPMPVSSRARRESSSARASRSFRRPSRMRVRAAMLKSSRQQA